MLLEQELASIIKYTLDNSGVSAPYYYSVPEGFIVPAVYFPAPEITSRGETFSTYALEYVWFIKFFHSTTQDAYALALKVLTALKKQRNLVPLLNEDGSKTGEYLRLNDPSVKAVDTGVAQLALTWTSRRPYDREKVQKMVVWEADFHTP